MSIDYNFIIACTAIVATLIAIITLQSESQRSRFSLGVDTILKLDSYFNSADFRIIRKNALDQLCSADPTEKSNVAAVDDVLDFFETVAILTRRGALDKVVVWNFFFFWMYGWHHYAKARIETFRDKDETVWAEFINLYTGPLLNIEKRKRQLSHLDVSLPKEMLQEFLNKESNL